MLRDVVWSDDGMYKVGDVYNPERFFSDALNKVLIYISTLENLRKAGVGKSSNQSFLFY